MISFEISHDALVWQEALSQFEEIDFHHTHSFHKTSKQNGEGEPLTVLGRNEDNILVFAWPLLARSIPNSELKDITSVYGYPGPLISNDKDESSVLKQALTFLKEQDFVSLFSRLHPILNQSLIENSNAVNSLYASGSIVVIDLETELSKIKKGIRGMKNGTIKKAINNGVTLRLSNQATDVNLFLKIYSETMDRISANEYYYFDGEYIQSMLDSDTFDAKFVFAEFDGNSIAAAMFIKTGNIVQYYLSGTMNEYSHLSPISLILWEEIQSAHSDGARWFVLGGGLGGGNDSLMHFKLGFSKTTFNTGSVRAVLNERTYNELSNGKSGDFFPLYRS